MTSAPTRSEVLRNPTPNAPLETEPPELGTELVPKDRYTSRAFAELEWRQMWRRVWLIAGRSSDLAEPGDYFSFEIGRESILVARQEDGRVGAHYNVCQHRGNRLVAPGRGRARRFVCPFHGWCYANDGSLVAAIDAHTFPQGAAGDRLALRPVRCEQWAGFVWVNLDPDCEPLAEFLGPVAAQLDAYHLEEWAIDLDVSIEVECNWKTSVDAFNEAYHVCTTHPQALPVADDLNCPIDFYGKHTRLIFREATASPRHAAYGRIPDYVREHYLRPAGVDVDALGDDPAAGRKALAEKLRGVLASHGADSSELSDDQMVDDFHFTVFPNITFNTHSLFTWVFRHRPHPEDPDRMIFDFWNLVRRPNQAVPRPEHLALRQQDGAELAQVTPEAGTGTVIDQDLSNLRTVQQGMHSDGFEGLHLSSQEIRIRHFHRVLMDYLGDAARQP